MKNKKSALVFLIGFFIGLALSNMITINGGFNEPWKNSLFIKLPIVAAIAAVLWFTIFRKIVRKIMSE